jgi:hypothetical protein
MHISVTEQESDLFRAYTSISLGDGLWAKFWVDNWLQGKTPKVIALNLFTLARHKNVTVAQALPGVDAGVTKDYNHDADSGVHRLVVHAVWEKAGASTGCHSVALHAKCEVLCKVGILGSVPGLVRRSRLDHLSMYYVGFGSRIPSCCLVGELYMHVRLI